MTDEEIHNIYLHMSGKAEGLVEATGNADFPVLFARAILEYEGMTKDAQNMASKSTYKEQLETKDEPAPVAKNEEGRITWMIDDWPQNCLLYTHPPQSFTYEQVKAHIRAASMSANDISVGSDTTEDGVSIVIRRRDELLYAEFFAYTPPQRTWVGLTKEEINQGLLRSFYVLEKARAWRDGVAWAEAKLKEKNT